MMIQRLNARHKFNYECHFERSEGIPINAGVAALAELRSATWGKREHLPGDRLPQGFMSGI
jgi:hypothetical protein